MGLLVAEIHLAPGRGFVEGFAHELEHVLEQLDGVRLGPAVKTPHARRVSLGGLYETARAVRVGRQVAAEHAAARSGAACTAERP